VGSSTQAQMMQLLFGLLISFLSFVSCFYQLTNIYFCILETMLLVMMNITTGELMLPTTAKTTSSLLNGM
jgi:hypothetical protein